jgi:tetratricopeptide (TPR) repeat protein
VSAACAQLTLFADGELAPAEAAAFSRHLASCAHCPAALGELLVLDDMVTEVDGAAARGVRRLGPASKDSRRGSFLQRVSRRGLVTAGGVALAAAAAAVFWLRPARAPGDALVAALADRPYRAQLARLSLPAADRWRPYNPARSGSAGEATQAPAEVARLAAVEETGDARALAAAYFLLGLPAQAAAYFAAGDDSADALSDRAAALLERGQLDQADLLLRRALALQPRHGQARWNRALVLRARGDRAGAARLFEELAAGERGGWAEEARTLARDLRP